MPVNKRKENEMSPVREALKSEWNDDYTFFDLYEEFAYRIPQ